MKREIVHEKIQKIPSKWPKDPLVKFFILLIQLSVVVFHEWSFSFSSSIFSFNLYILNLNLICHLNKTTFTSRLLIADFPFNQLFYYFYFEIISWWLFRSLNKDASQFTSRNYIVDLRISRIQRPGTIGLD